MSKCNMIDDLLPLYTDGVCSEESRRMVAEHVAECAACRGKLEKMSETIAVESRADIAAIKRIKRRIRIEKAVVACILAAAVLIFGGFLLMWLVNTDCTMDYEKYHLAENVWVEEDADGSLWLVRTGSAAEAYFIHPNVLDSNGNTMQDEEFDRDQVCAYTITLKQRKILSLMNFVILDGGMEERVLLWDSAKDYEKFETLYYYDDENHQKYVLWERD